MSPPSTPFARRLLPRFSAWFNQALDQTKPNYLVPVERKGAHLLDAVLDYLRMQEGIRIRASVLYKRAFSYIPASVLDGATIVLLDDSTYTGRTLDEYRSAVKTSGNAHVRMLACIGASLSADDPAAELRSEIDCFLEPDRDEYNEYLWELSELVVARGLTPEVDHHQFRLSTGSSLFGVWPRILSALAEHGVLDVHGPLEINTGRHGATLHWPSFLPPDLLPPAGIIHKDGVVKLRLFADFTENTVTAIPMVYPEVLFPSSTMLQEARASFATALKGWIGPRDSVVHFLLDSAPTASTEVFFNATSLHCEAVLMSSFAAILRASLTDYSSLAVTVDRASLLRLYGPRVAGELADRLDRQLLHDAPIVEHCEWIETTAVTHGASTDQINVDVDAATDQLLLFLKSAYKERNSARPRHEWETVGFGFAELRTLPLFQPETDGALLLSRCIDLGCSTTGLVPYTTREVSDSGGTLLVRKYRTAESVHNDDGRLEDFRTYQREVAAEIVAAVANYVSRRSVRWKGRPTPQFVLDKIVAILIGAAPDAAERRSLVVVPKEHGPEAAFVLTPLVGSPSTRLIRQVASELYSVGHDGGIESTSTFLLKYSRGTLRLARREELLALEAYLQALVSVLDNLDNVSDVLICWAISASGRLGLDYVMADVELALEAVSEPIEVLAGGRRLDRRKLNRSCRRASHFLGVATGEKLQPLSGTWWSPVREQWPDPIAVEVDLLASMGVAREGSVLFSLARAYVHAVGHLVAILRLSEGIAVADGNQQLLFSRSDSDRLRARSRSMEELSTLVLRLRSLRDEASYPGLPGHGGAKQDSELARYFKGALEVLRRFASAFAWSYSRLMDWRRPQLPESTPRNRTVLFADLAGSTPAALGLPHDENVRWKNNGLDLLAQWGHAFGGSEGDSPIRRGDDICLEFMDPDSAILCAVVAQEHLRALRSTDLPENTYRFRMAIDSFWINSADGGNRISLAIDRAAKTAKAPISDEPEDATAVRIAITPEVVRECSSQLREFLVESTSTLQLGEGDRGEFRPWRVNRVALIEAYIQRLDELRAPSDDAPMAGTVT